MKCGVGNGDKREQQHGNCNILKKEKKKKNRERASYYAMRPDNCLDM